jgi:hypothetical protein
MSSNLKLPENNQRLESFGCKLSAGGAHNSRTMMLDEISRLLTSVSDSASADEYKKAILENNILGKGTITTRAKTYRYLRELYALSDQVNHSSQTGLLRFINLNSAILKVYIHIPEAFPVGELGECHAEVLVPAGKADHLVIAVVSLDAFSEFVCGDKVHQLGKDRFPGIHVPPPHSLMRKIGTSGGKISNR